MKSVWGSGRKPSFWWLCPSPVPNNPPGPEGQEGVDDLEPGALGRIGPGIGEGGYPLGPVGGRSSPGPRPAAATMPPRTSELLEPGPSQKEDGHQEEGEQDGGHAQIPLEEGQEDHSPADDQMGQEAHGEGGPCSRLLLGHGVSQIDAQPQLGQFRGLEGEPGHSRSQLVASAHGCRPSAWEEDQDQEGQADYEDGVDQGWSSREVLMNTAADHQGQAQTQGQGTAS